MKRFYIIVEGQTEQAFVNEVLAPYLVDRGVPVAIPILINTSKTGRGGHSNYEHLRNTVIPLLKGTHAQEVTVTSLIDFFRIPTNMPQYDQCMAHTNKHECVQSLEKAIEQDIKDPRFFAYIQLHEFEALLFSNNKGFESYWSASKSKLSQQIIATFDNPESINTSPSGAPSKRLKSIRPSYDKVIEGNIIALEIGIQDMLQQCPRFRAWVERIIATFN